MRTYAGDVRVEAVRARRSERAEALALGPRRQRGPIPAAARMQRVRTSPRASTCPVSRRRRCSPAETGPLAPLGPGERLLGAVVDARDAEREQLDGDAGHDLVVARRIGREAHLVARDVVVVVQDRDVPLAGLAVRARVRRPTRASMSK